MSVKIVPAILEKDFDLVDTKLKKFSKFFIFSDRYNRWGI